MSASRQLTLMGAVNEAMKQEMRRDPTIFLMGEDVGIGDGTFGASPGLLKEFGPDRVLDTPLSEAGFIGAGVGARQEDLDRYQAIRLDLPCLVDNAHAALAEPAQQLIPRQL